MAIIKYKSGGSWISIPIYVNTGGEVLDYVTRSELESMGYISELKTINNQSLIGSGNINIAVDLSGYYTKTEVDNLIPSLDNYYDKTETYSQSEINALLDSAGNIDLTNYYTKTETYSQSEVNSLIDNINAGSVDLTNYYTKTEVDNLIPNDYLTSSSLSGYATQSWVNNQDFASSSDIPTSVSELTNDMGYLTSIPSSYVTETELSSTLSDYVKASDVIAGEGAIKINYSEIENYMSREITEDGKLYFSLSDTSAYSNVINEAIVTTKQTVIISTTPSDYNRAYVDLVINPTSNYYNYHYTCEINGLIGVGISLFKVHGRVHVMPVDSNMIGLLFYVPKDCYSPVDIHYLTYSELKTLADNYGLVAGRKYGITDYSCIYTQPVSNVEMEVSADDIEAIICTAVTEETLSENVEIVRSEGYVPIIECKYSIDPESRTWTAGMTTLSPKGVIWYMKDANGNECNYDFKHVKFRRWAVTDITPNDDDDTGSGNPGAYAYCITDTCYNLSDNRKRIGSGESTDKTIVENVFAGTWAGCIPELTKCAFITIPDTFHSDYALYCHKPYQDTSDSYIKYISWTDDMTSSIGVNSPMSYSTYSTSGDVTGTASILGNQKITVNTSSYIDCYTFEYQGTDASEKVKYGSTDPLVQLVVINTTNNKDLSNTCFIFTSKIMSDTSTFLRNINLPHCVHNTFLLRGFSQDGLYGSIANFSCKDKFQFNLIITHFINQVVFHHLVGCNYLCADFQYGVFDLFMRLTMFGYYSQLHFGVTSVPNLWYSSFSRVKYTGDSSWVSPKDGMYSYNIVTKDWLGGNIMGPIQYGEFAPHFDRMTFRSFYNKGCRFGSNNLCCSLGECSYSDIGYGGLGQFIKFEKIWRSQIPIISFAQHNTTTSTGVVTWKTTTPTVPDLYGVTVSAAYGTVTNISDYTGNVNISSNTTTNGLPRKLLYSLGSGNWGATYEHGLESIITSSAATTNLEEEDVQDDMPIEEPLA